MMNYLMSHLLQFKKRLALKGKSSEKFPPFQAVVLTDRGCVRSHNEDGVTFLLGTQHDCLGVVADGMGGHCAGEIASNTTIDSLAKSFQEQKIYSPNSLESACTEANRCVWEKSSNNPSYRGMGTTCSALYLQGSRGYFAHIGDSRIYHLCDHTWRQITIDHTLKNELSKCDPHKAAETPRHILTRALGLSKEVDFDSSRPINVKEGDRFLICSDGLYDIVEDQELIALGHLKDLRLAAETMMALALHRGAPDNVSLAFIHINQI